MAGRETTRHFAIAVAVCAGLAGLLLAPGALANGIGDLYAGTARSVVELHVASATIVNAVEVPPRPLAMAFSPDGRSLYVSTGRRRLELIDIQTISLAAPIDLPADSAAIAQPHGDRLVVALPALSRLATVDRSDGVVTETAALPGKVDLVAADRRQARVLAARAGEGWVAVLDPASGAVETTRLEGAVVAVAVDRAEEAGYVATRDPDRLTRLGLADLEPIWVADLPAPAVAVVATAGGAVVASADALWSVDETGVERWASSTGPLLTLAVSDDGRVVYAAGRDLIEVFAGSGGAPVRQVAPPDSGGSIVLAAVPAPSSLDGGSPSGSGPAGQPTGQPQLPQTSTPWEAGARWLQERVPPLGAVLVVAGWTLLAGWRLRARGARRTVPVPLQVRHPGVGPAADPSAPEASPRSPDGQGSDPGRP